MNNTIKNKLFFERFPGVVKLFERYENTLKDSPYNIVLSKNSEITICFNMGGTQSYLHSQYNPLLEAKNIVSGYSDVSEYDQVVFYGVGLGYHVEEFVRQHPSKSIVLYEPKPSVFYRYVQEKEISRAVINNMEGICLEFSVDQIDGYIKNMVQGKEERTLIIMHPAYERLFEDSARHFLSRFREIIKTKRFNLNVNEVFEKLWVANSSLNFGHLITTPTIFQFEELLGNKPVLLVSAGPSLQEEIERLKRIRKNNMAYIFAVGSANKVLISHGILPHAVCGYDPSPNQYTVFDEIITNQISSVPLIFGSPIGALTLEKYPGPMIHFTTGQDTVANYLLGAEELKERQELVNDAPSIAGVMLEILCKLQSKIILVGQNLALRNNQYYSSGISYENRPTGLTEEDQKNMEQVIDINGNPVYTLPEFIMMRKHMEIVLSSHPSVEVYNTTQGGASIMGTTFVGLDKAMETLMTKGIAQENWHHFGKPDFNQKGTRERLSHLIDSYKELSSLLDETTDSLRKLLRLSEQRKLNQVSNMFPKFDKSMTKILKNDFYKVYIEPMNRIKHELLVKKIPGIKDEANLYKKSQLIVDAFGKYLYECKSSMSVCNNLVSKLSDVYGSMQENQIS